MQQEILRYTAFAAEPGGGNPAGLVLDAAALSDDEMLAIAREVGYPETAFVVGTTASGPRVRYFSPGAEVPFCGHATVALAVALAERDGLGRRVFTTAAGEVALDATTGPDGAVQVAMTSVEPATRDIDPALLARLFDLLGLEAADIASGFPVLESFAGNWHPVLVLHDRELFHQFRFAPGPLADLKREAGWRRDGHGAAPDRRAVSTRRGTCSPPGASPRTRRRARRRPRPGRTCARSVPSSRGTASRSGRGATSAVRACCSSTSPRPAGSP